MNSAKIPDFSLPIVPCKLQANRQLRRGGHRWQTDHGLKTAHWEMRHHCLPGLPAPSSEGRLQLGRRACLSHRHSRVAKRLSLTQGPARDHDGRVAGDYFTGWGAFKNEDTVTHEPGDAANKSCHPRCKPRM